MVKELKEHMTTKLKKNRSTMSHQREFLELKRTITEMKNSVEYLAYLSGEKKISELEDRTIEIIQSDEQILRDLCDTIKLPIYTQHESQKEKKRERGKKNICKNNGQI